MKRRAQQEQPGLLSMIHPALGPMVEGVLRQDGNLVRIVKAFETMNIELSTQNEALKGAK